MNDLPNSDDQVDNNVKSKSQIKREFKDLQELGKQLVGLPNKRLAAIPLSEKMHGLVSEAKTQKHGVLNRQLRLIGSWMPEEDVEAIRAALEQLNQPRQQQVSGFHELEQWRDRLMQGDAAAFQELSEKFIHFEHQHVNQLIRNAKKEQEQNKPPKSIRLLFQYLRNLQELDL